MTAAAEAKAPGCFGAASVFSMDSTVCNACLAFTACGDAAVKTLESIRELIDVRDILARHAAARQKVSDRIAPKAPPTPVVASPLPMAQPKPVTQPVERKTPMAKVTFDISDDDQHVIAIIGERSSKTKEQAIVLCKNNKINAMRSGLPQRVNPFATSGPQFLRIACDLLINGGFTKASLKAQMVSELSWTDGTAGSHVAIACALLYAFKIVVDKNGAFILNPDLG